MSLVQYVMGCDILLVDINTHVILLCILKFWKLSTAHDQTATTATSAHSQTWILFTFFFEGLSQNTNIKIWEQSCFCCYNVVYVKTSQVLWAINLLLTHPVMDAIVNGLYSFTYSLTQPKTSLDNLKSPRIVIWDMWRMYNVCLVEVEGVGFAWR